MHKARRAFENRQELRDERASGGKSGSTLSNHVREAEGNLLISCLPAVCKP
jgi:hypothetical protein